MTWAEWGTLIYRNGKRRLDREERLKTCEYHGQAGDGRVKLQWDRAYPSLRIDGERVEVEEVPGFEDWDSLRSGPQEASGGIEGAHLHLKCRPDESVIDFVFIEPDGTKWTGSAGHLTSVVNDMTDRDSEQKISAPSLGYHPPWAAT